MHSLLLGVDNEVEHENIRKGSSVEQIDSGFIKHSKGLVLFVIILRLGPLGRPVGLIDTLGMGRDETVGWKKKERDGRGLDYVISREKSERL